ncbi:hypothetical protein L1887_56034 [Cichorium endivia]|nr:hypothetical protein L1887_56034 [Cichorium endivia]
MPRKRGVGEETDELDGLAATMSTLAPGGALGEADGGEDGGLVEVDAVEGDIDEEPAGGASDELLCVFPLGEVLDELVLGLPIDLNDMPTAVFSMGVTSPPRAFSLRSSSSELERLRLLWPLAMSSGSSWSLRAWVNRVDSTRVRRK